MTTHTPHQLLVGVVFAASLVVCGANQTAAADDLTIFVALTDSEGEPVTDLAAKDFAILWDGVACDILERRGVNRDGLTRQPAGLDESLLHPRKDGPVRLQIDLRRLGR